MGWLGWIILGGLAGLVANMITHEEGGLLKNIVLGVIGGVVGGWLVELIGGSGVNGFNLYSFVVAVLGAMLLIYIVRMIKK